GGDADPGVAHRDLDAAVAAARAHADAAAVGGELHGVGEQVHEHLLDLPLVADGGRQIGLHLDVQGELVAGRAVPHEGDRVVDGHLDVERGQLQLHAPGFDLGEVQDVVDE